MGIKKKRTEDFYVIEGNLVNAIVLNDLSIVHLPSRECDEFSLPKTLYDYQHKDVVKMVEGVQVLNTNRMGYGKTVETIAALKASQIKNAIIIAPKPVLTQWAAQIKRWWRGCPEVAVVPDKLIDGINLLNFEQTISDRKQAQLRSRVWDAVVVDESQRIKNPSAKRTLAATLVPARVRYALTGTPILRNPEDLYSQLRFLNPAYSGGSFYAFREYFCDIKMGFFGEENKGLTKSEFRVSVLHKLLKIVAVQNPEMILAKGKLEIVEKLSMVPQQRRLYKDVVQLALDSLPEGCTIPNGATRTLRAQQVTTSPSLFTKAWGSKFEWLRALIEDNPDEKIVVFSKFSKSVSELKRYLSKSRIECLLYTGDIDTPDRHDHLHRFQKDSHVRVLAGTIACLGEGVDGLQHCSHIVVFLDRPYSPELINQCEDRLNRPGQHHKVLCYFLECAGTYDRHFGRVNETRADDIRRALKYDESDDT